MEAVGLQIKYGQTYLVIIIIIIIVIIIIIIIMLLLLLLAVAYSNVGATKTELEKSLGGRGRN